MKRRILWTLVVIMACWVVVQAQNVQLSDGTLAVKMVTFDKDGGEATPLTSGDLAQDATHDQAAISTGPQLVGYASDAQPTAVADADAARLWSDHNGRIVTSPYSSNANWVKGIGNATLSATDVQVVAAQGAGVSFCATTIVISNSSATAVVATLTDGNGGSDLVNIPAAANMGGAAITLPVPICTSANTSLFLSISTNATTISATAVGFKSAL